MRRTPLVFAVLVVSLAGRAAHAQPAPPEAPQVDDPMLVPVARPKIEVGSWEEALEHVRARSTDLRIAAQETARAEAQSRIAIAGALTTVNGQGTFTHNIITDTMISNTPSHGFGTGSLVASQPVLALRAWYGIGTAERKETVAYLTFEETKRQISLNVANAIVAVVTAERVGELNRLGLRSALTRLELIIRRSTLGNATGLDVVRARQDVESARVTLLAGDESLRRAREELGLALGIAEEVGVPPNAGLDGIEASARASCRANRSIDDRPDVAALHERAAVAHRLVNDMKLQFAPTVDLRSAITATTLDTGAAPNPTWNVQAVLTVPIWDGGVRGGNVQDSHAQEAIAGRKLEAARRQAAVQVTQARRGVSVAEDRLRVALQMRNLAAETERLTHTAYFDGRATSLELVTAAQGLREAEIQLAVHEFELVKARILAHLSLAYCPW